MSHSACADHPPHCNPRRCVTRCVTQCATRRVACVRRGLRTYAARTLLLAVAGCLAVFARADELPAFNQQVRPILAEYCWSCHGPDANARQGGLRLDVRADALQPADSGRSAIVPHTPEASELLARITATDPDRRMPPPDSGRQLSADQIAALRAWIAAGAEYQRHWSFEPLQAPPVPPSLSSQHPLDAFVEAELRQRGLSLSPAAPRDVLLRRVSLDLTGLPPTLADLERTDETYEQAVDRLLASPHFGERMAVDWLDAARYADTNGYFSDKPRQMWLWRDWVIEAFNSNMPFDRFTIEQLAGDLLPQASVQQRIATGFNRNHMANNETGIIDEEFRVEYVVDRVDTTFTVWMGLTAGCAQCHDHKYDPLSQRDFYQLFAFFNNVPEQGLIVADNPPPLLTVTTPQQDQQLAALTAARAAAEAAWRPLQSRVEAELQQWEASALQNLPQPPAGAVLHESFDDRLSAGGRAAGTPLKFEAGVHGAAARLDATQHVEHTLADFNPDAPWTIGFWMQPDGSLSCPLSLIEAAGDRRGFEILLQKGRVAVHLVEHWGVSAIEVTSVQPVAARQWHHVSVSYDGSRRATGLRLLIDGRPAEVRVQRDQLNGSLRNQEVLRIGRRDEGLGYYGLLDEVRILPRWLSDQEIADWVRGEQLRGILEKPAGARSARETELLLDDFLLQQADPTVQAARQRVQELRQEEAEFRRSLPTTLVMEELPEPRTTHVLLRGQYDHPGEVVLPGIPAEFSGWPEDAPRNRLGLGQWLVSPQNPLTARVAVNRLWRQCFGEGLVRTVNDFGTQGEPPSHPALLDWLATTFRDSGWDVKALLRLIVTSQTYRQQSQPLSGAAEAADPQNRWLSRGPRFRLSAEMLRDQALTVSGLLRPQIGGPSVKPYQPPGLWEEVSYNGEDSYVPDQGDGRWRRTLYTFVKRQAPPPALLAFDGPTREKCVVQRARTNTPLQALILLNEPVYLEAARALAATVVQSAADERSGVQQLFRRVLARYPDETETAALCGLWQRQLERFSQTPAAVEQLLTDLPADSSAGSSADPQAGARRAELAAWTVVAHTILNLDEALTRR